MHSEPTAVTSVQEFGPLAKKASKTLAWATTREKNLFLEDYAHRIQRLKNQLIEANQADVHRAQDQGISGAFLDRLTLDEKRIASMLEGLSQVGTLADPVGQVRESRTAANGLKISKVGVPLGVVFFIYESRPNVTVDAVALCVKSGNAVVLRGGSEAVDSNTLLVSWARESLVKTGLPENACQLVPPRPRAWMDSLLEDAAHIDLVIPRGGRELIERVVRKARMPVIKHYTGNCHVYVEKSACPQMALSLLINSKCQRPGVCNAAESLLVDEAIAASWLPGALKALFENKVEVRGCPATQALDPRVKPASNDDFFTEYNDLILSVRIVKDIHEAIDHIGHYASGHTEAIVTNSIEASRLFTTRVDSSAVMVNASTRFNDGFELGLGAEIGISTDKFHARGPCGLNELTSSKFLVEGWGQVRG